MTCRYVLWTLPAPEVALSGWASALRPGGAVLIADGRWRTARQPPRLIPGAVRDYLAMGRSLPNFRGVTASQTGGLLRRAGFEHPRSFAQLLERQTGQGTAGTASSSGAVRNGAP